MPAVPIFAALLFAAGNVHAQECATDADCAAGWECAWAGESNTSIGGGPGPVCSDGTCDAGETAESCPQDCSEDRICRVAFQMCNEDAECAPGFYCDDERGPVSTVGSVTGSTTGSASYDGTCELVGTTSGVGGGSATDGGAGAASEGTDGSAEVTNGSDSSSNDGINGTTVGSSSTVTTGSNPSGSGGGGHGGPSGGNVSGSGHGPWNPHWPGHGCSVGGFGGAPASGLFLSALAALGMVFVRRRQS
ncbi:MAG TPA: hypothetical protein VFU02_19050 [Polyangiaceae bacterium]|nr:hypothetical protein [Polyangiaceae bacterium]